MFSQAAEGPLFTAGKSWFKCYRVLMLYLDNCYSKQRTTAQRSTQQRVGGAQVGGRVAQDGMCHRKGSAIFRALVRGGEGQRRTRSKQVSVRQTVRVRTTPLRLPVVMCVRVTHEARVGWCESERGMHETYGGRSQAGGPSWGRTVRVRLLWC